MLPNFRSKQGAFSQAYRTDVKEKERSKGRKGGDRCLLASFKTRPKTLVANEEVFKELIEQILLKSSFFSKDTIYVILKEESSR
ncbi:hypothetical protein EV213_10861 [Aureibacillus halotolerans]|uniref:Uncharacterized protein n=1 Tax=Aureibacillus halotolerans TaxID=1508390 RepID=A0A4R6U7T1_9BACI|nr:hypothetical protein EV213_10861 [Aureibacillus halotolerans]